jgi:hypothetical protein
MSQAVRHAELRGKSQQLLHGALRHVRVAALAAALVPLGAVAVSPAVALASGSGGSVAAVPSPCDTVAGAGAVVTESNTKAKFEAHGGCKHGTFWGKVTYKDRATDYDLHSTQITGYLTPFPGSNIRDICGVATTNVDQSPVLFRVRLIDNGDPATSEFGIRVSDGYYVATSANALGSGDVELQDPNPSTVGPNPAPDEFTMCGGLAEP